MFINPNDYKELVNVSNINSYIQKQTSEDPKFMDTVMKDLDMQCLYVEHESEYIENLR